jgi:hypothetical protein
LEAVRDGIGARHEQEEPIVRHDAVSMHFAAAPNPRGRWAAPQCVVQAIFSMFRRIFRPNLTHLPFASVACAIPGPAAGNAMPVAPRASAPPFVVAAHRICVRLRARQRPRSRTAVTGKK